MAKQRVLMDFWLANQPKDNLIYKDTAWRQRDYFEKMGHMLERVSGQSVELEVAGSHRSKSVILPVVEFKLPNASIVVRDNLYNFAVSVTSPGKPVPKAMLDAVSDGEATSACYCEGFPQERVYGSQDQNPEQFTTHIWDKDLFSYFMVSFGKLHAAPKNTAEMKPAI